MSLCARTSSGKALVCEPTKQVIESGRLSFSRLHKAVAPIMLVVPELGFCPYTTKQTKARIGFGDSLDGFGIVQSLGAAIQNGYAKAFGPATLSQQRHQVGVSTAE